MKAEDLMIGDWVTITEPDDFHGYVGQVKIINSETYYITVYIPNMHLHDVFADDLQPIPLTEEILEKNGFKKVEKDLFHLGQSSIGVDTWLGIDNNVIYIDALYHDGEIAFCKCEYVHELQHAMKLGGNANANDFKMDLI